MLIEIRGEKLYVDGVEYGPVKKENSEEKLRPIVNLGDTDEVNREWLKSMDDRAKIFQAELRAVGDLAKFFKNTNDLMRPIYPPENATSPEDFFGQGKSITVENWIRHMFPHVVIKDREEKKPVIEDKGSSVKEEEERAKERGMGEDVKKSPVVEKEKRPMPDSMEILDNGMLISANTALRCIDHLMDVRRKRDNGIMTESNYWRLWDVCDFLTKSVAIYCKKTKEDGK